METKNDAEKTILSKNFKPPAILLLFYGEGICASGGNGSAQIVFGELVQNPRIIC
jgi:hypothetical protein